MDLYEHRYFHIESEPPRSEDVANIPSLTSLSCEAELANLRNAANAIEDHAKPSLEDVRLSKNNSVDEIVESSMSEVQASAEAAEVRRLQKDLAEAQKCLRQQAFE